ncbi:hypothetical protein FOZ62_012232, partial [Perkinsus olseni]
EWIPSVPLPRGTSLKICIVRQHPDYRASLLASGLPFLPEAQQQLVEASLQSATWRSYRCALKVYLLWSWDTFPSTPAIPASPERIRAFLTTRLSHVRYLPALRKAHLLLQYPLQFDDPLTKAIARGCSNALSQQRKEKEGISLHFLESLVRQATLHKLHLFKALIVLAYCFSCRVPSELLNESNRSLHIHENAVTLRLFR